MRYSLGDGNTAQTVNTIVQIVILLVSSGYSLFSAMKQAKAEAGIQRELTAQENNGIAYALYTHYHTAHPQLTVEDWIVYIQFGGDPFIRKNDVIPTETNYWLYLAIFVIVLVGIK